MKIASVTLLPILSVILLNYSLCCTGSEHSSDYIQFLIKNGLTSQGLSVNTTRNHSLDVSTRQQSQTARAQSRVNSMPNCRSARKDTAAFNDSQRVHGGAGILGRHPQDIQLQTRSDLRLRTSRQNSQDLDKDYHSHRQVQTSRLTRDLPPNYQRQLSDDMSLKQLYRQDIPGIFSSEKIPGRSSHASFSRNPGGTVYSDYDRLIDSFNQMRVHGNPGAGQKPRFTRSQTKGAAIGSSGSSSRAPENNSGEEDYTRFVLALVKKKLNISAIPATLTLPPEYLKAAFKLGIPMKNMALFLTTIKLGGGESLDHINANAPIYKRITMGKLRQTAAQMKFNDTPLSGRR